MINFIKSTVMRFHSAIVSYFCVRHTSKRQFLRIVQGIMRDGPFDCHVGIHVDFTSILHSHASLVPQALCEVNLDRLHLFHQ